MPDVKVCTRCGQEKPVSEYYVIKTNKGERHGSRCKSCCSETKKEYRKRPEVIAREKTYGEVWREEHREEQRIKDKHRRDNPTEEQRRRKKEKDKRYRDSHKAEVRAGIRAWTEKNKERDRQQRRQYYQDNRERLLKDIYRRKEERRKEDALFDLKCRVRHTISEAFRRADAKKCKRTAEILGCSVEFLREHLNSTFFRLYGRYPEPNESVHIDHILPVSAAETVEDVLRLNHYTNLQLLRAQDNLKKSARLDWTPEEIK
jgi:hypothetical protein